MFKGINEVIAVNENIRLAVYFTLTSIKIHADLDTRSNAKIFLMKYMAARAMSSVAT